MSVLALGVLSIVRERVMLGLCIKCSYNLRLLPTNIVRINTSTSCHLVLQPFCSNGFNWIERRARQDSFPSSKPRSNPVIVTERLESIPKCMNVQHMRKQATGNGISTSEGQQNSGNQVLPSLICFLFVFL